MELQALLKQTDALQWILLGAFFGSFLIQVYFYLCIYLRLGRHRNDELPASREGVSLLISARNEAENLERFLPAFLTQDYPEYEVVVVNDRSTDHSEEVLGRLAQLYPHLRFTSLPATDAPLKAGPDAITLDTTDMAIEDAVAQAEALVRPAFEAARG
jgi:cellulose synthase/poly-beta-1,6-N-acetylglucosamine synthase-like glycosyltransferase